MTVVTTADRSHRKEELAFEDSASRVETPFTGSIRLRIAIAQSDTPFVVVAREHQKLRVIFMKASPVGQLLQPGQDAIASLLVIRQQVALTQRPSPQAPADLRVDANQRTSPQAPADLIQVRLARDPGLIRLGGPYSTRRRHQDPGELGRE